MGQAALEEKYKGTVKGTLLSFSRCSRNPAAGYQLFLQVRMWQGCFGDLVPRARSKPKAGNLPSYATQTQQAELPKKGGG